MSAQRAQRGCREANVFEAPLRTFAAPLVALAVKI
jgi:hypothetical protein